MHRLGFGARIQERAHAVRPLAVGRAGRQNPDVNPSAARVAADSPTAKVAVRAASSASE